MTYVSSLGGGRISKSSRRKSRSPELQHDATVRLTRTTTRHSFSRLLLFTILHKKIVPSIRVEKLKKTPTFCCFLYLSCYFESYNKNIWIEFNVYNENGNVGNRVLANQCPERWQRNYIHIRFVKNCSIWRFFCKICSRIKVKLFRNSHKYHPNGHDEQRLSSIHIQ